MNPMRAVAGAWSRRLSTSPRPNDAAQILLQPLMKALMVVQLLGDHVARSHVQRCGSKSRHRRAELPVHIPLAQAGKREGATTFRRLHGAIKGSR